MEIFNPKKLNIQFTRLFKIFATISLVVCVGAIVSFFTPGLNYGIDFKGGIEAHVAFEQKGVTVGALREILDSKMQNLNVVAFSDTDKPEFLITAQAKSKESISDTLKAALSEKFSASGPTTWEIKKLDIVGPKVGAELRKSALLSIIYTCILITIYMFFRFDLRFSPGALLGIAHDVLVTVLFLSLTGIEFSTTVVAALLTLAGYSINDTVVVYDRIRELEGKYLGRDKHSIVNLAINSTLSRTIMTASTTLISCIVLYFVGGPALENFAATLFVGIIAGTYSSIFVAAPLYLWGDKVIKAKTSTAAANS